jgi:hypothetical protein
MRSPPCSSNCPLMRTPLSIVPFTLPQSRTYHCPASCMISAWRRERNRSRIGTVQSAARPRVTIVSASDIS